MSDVEGDGDGMGCFLICAGLALVILSIAAAIRVVLFGFH